MTRTPEDQVTDLYRELRRDVDVLLRHEHHYRPAGREYLTSPDLNVSALAHWMADDVAVADGDPVTSWVDRIGGVAVVSTGVGSDPTYDHDGVGGFPAVSFGAGLLEYAAANALSTATSGHVFAVVHYNLLPGSAETIWGSTNTTAVSNAYYVWGRLNSLGVLIQQDDGFSGTDALQGTSPLPPTGQACLIEWASNGSAYTISVDGVATTLSTISGANTGDWFGDTTNRGNFTIGGRRTSGGAEGAYVGAQLATLIVFDGAVSGGDRAAIEAWAQARGAAI